MTAAPTVDVVVVGAGPAGASAATTLCRSGLSTVVVDRATFPRDKTCGDGLTTGALRELETLGIDRAAVPSWRVVDTLHLSSPSRHTIELPLPTSGTYAAIARRHELDAELVRTAAANGADVREGWAFDDLTLDADGAELVVRDGDGTRDRIRARYVVAADGMWSPVRRHLRVDDPGYRGDWHAFRQYVRGVHGPARDDLFVWFEPDFLPGYLWSFPLADGTANIGFGIRRGGRWQVRDMARLWPELLARPHVRAALGDAVAAEGPHRAWPIPARVDRTVAAADRVLFAGDALAATDPLTGEGIGQALLSGRWAAEAIRDGGPHDPLRTAARYRRAVDRGLVADHRMAALLAAAMSHRKGARFGVWMAGLSPWTRRNFARWLFEDYPRAVAATPRRWRASVLDAPPPYPDRAQPGAAPPGSVGDAVADTVRAGSA